MEINKIIISGRLVEKPELKKLGDADLCNFRIASNRIVGKKKTEKTIFISVDVWGGNASVCEKFLKKGSRVAVEGTLCQDTWDDKESGKKNSKIFIEANEVVFLDSAEQSAKPEEPAKQTKATPASAPARKPAPVVKDDEEVPF